MICLYKNTINNRVAYPGKAFNDEDKDKKSKKYVQRFLDATKSDMLFADKVILVEGIAEQLLLSIFADYMGISLEENHVAVINVGGRYFEHFLKLFDNKNSNAIDRKVACITDRDPERKELSGGKYGKTYPFEYNIDSSKYEYKQNTYLDKYLKAADSNIRTFTQDEKFGKTFEYDLVLYNTGLKILLTDSISNKEELGNLMDCYNNGESIENLKLLLHKSDENERIISGIDDEKLDWSDNDKKKAIIASRYLNSVGKGENALELAYALKNNLDNKDTEEYYDFIVPEYIQEAIRWVCK